MSEKKALESLAIDIKSFLISAPGGRSCEEILADYKAINKQPIPFRKFGFRSERDVLDDLVRVGDLNFSRGRYSIQGAGASGAQHLVYLVSSQKTGKVSQFKGKPNPPTRAGRGGSLTRGRGRGTRGGNLSNRGGTSQQLNQTQHSNPSPQPQRNSIATRNTNSSRATRASSNGRGRGVLDRANTAQRAPVRNNSELPNRSKGNDPGHRVSEEVKTSGLPSIYGTESGSVSSSLFQMSSSESMPRPSSPRSPSTSRPLSNDAFIELINTSVRISPTNYENGKKNGNLGTELEGKKSTAEVIKRESQGTVPPPPGFDKQRSPIIENTSASDAREKERMFPLNVLEAAMDAAVDALIRANENDRINPREPLSITNFLATSGLQESEIELVTCLRACSAKPHSLFRVIGDDTTGYYLHLKPLAHLFPDLEFSIRKNGPASLNHVLRLWKVEQKEGFAIAVAELNRTETFCLLRSEGAESLLKVTLNKDIDSTHRIYQQKIVVAKDLPEEELETAWLQIHPLEVTHPHSFSFASADETDKVKEMVFLMTEFYGHHGGEKSLAFTLQSQLCAVPDGKEWRRAKLLRKSKARENGSGSDALWLRFMDTGTVGRVEFESCKRLLSVFQEHPALAKAGEMEHQPKGDVWGEEAIIRFKEFFADQGSQNDSPVFWVYPLKLVAKEWAGHDTVQIIECCKTVGSTELFLSSILMQFYADAQEKEAESDWIRELEESLPDE